MPRRVPLMVADNNDVVAKTLPGFVSLLQVHPDNHTRATWGLDTTQPLEPEMLNRVLQVKMQIVTHKGAVPQHTEVVGGHVSAASSLIPGVSFFVQAGRLRALAVTSKTRARRMPDVPTVAERGVAGFQLLSWMVRARYSPHDV